MDTIHEGFILVVILALVETKPSNFTANLEQQNSEKRLETDPSKIHNNGKESIGNKSMFSSNETKNTLKDHIIAIASNSLYIKPEEIDNYPLANKTAFNTTEGNTTQGKSAVYNTTEGNHFIGGDGNFSKQESSIKEDNPGSAFPAWTIGLVIGVCLLFLLIIIIIVVKKKVGKGPDILAFLRPRHMRQRFEGVRTRFRRVPGNETEENNV